MVGPLKLELSGETEISFRQVNAKINRFFKGISHGNVQFAIKMIVRRMR